MIKANQKFDKAVEAAYCVDFDGDDQKIVAHLFDLYAFTRKKQLVSLSIDRKMTDWIIDIEWLNQFGKG